MYLAPRDFAGLIQPSIHCFDTSWIHSYHSALIPNPQIPPDSAGHLMLARTLLCILLCIDKINLYYNAKKGQHLPTQVQHQPVCHCTRWPRCSSSSSVFFIICVCCCCCQCRRRQPHHCHHCPCSSLSVSVPGLVFMCLYPLALGWCSFDVIGVLAGVGPFIIVLDGVGISIHAGVGSCVRLPE